MEGLLTLTVLAAFFNLADAWHGKVWSKGVARRWYAEYANWMAFGAPCYLAWCYLL